MTLMSSMGWYWIVVPLFLAVVGLLIVVSGLIRLFGGRPGPGLTNLVVGTPLAVIGLAAGLLAMNTQTLARLSYEEDIAVVGVNAKEPARQLYTVTVSRKDEAKSVHVCEIQGDEWEMTARVQKWKPWANVLGLDTTYSIEQLSNRYFDAASANGRTITACDLRGNAPVVNQYVPKHWITWLIDKSYTEDRRFGSAAFMPLADGAIYRVVMTQSGLNAEPANDVAQQVNDAR